jgi:hypothetical protein
VTILGSGRLTMRRADPDPSPTDRMPPPDPGRPAVVSSRGAVRCVRAFRAAVRPVAGDGSTGGPPSAVRLQPVWQYPTRPAPDVPGGREPVLRQAAGVADVALLPVVPGAVPPGRVLAVAGARDRPRPRCPEDLAQPSSRGRLAQGIRDHGVGMLMVALGSSCLKAWGGRRWARALPPHWLGSPMVVTLVSAASQGLPLDAASVVVLGVPADTGAGRRGLIRPAARDWYAWPLLTACGPSVRKTGAVTTPSVAESALTLPRPTRAAAAIPGGVNAGPRLHLRRRHAAVHGPARSVAHHADGHRASVDSSARGFDDPATHPAVGGLCGTAGNGYCSARAPVWRSSSPRRSSRAAPMRVRLVTRAPRR